MPRLDHFKGSGFYWSECHKFTVKNLHWSATEAVNATGSILDAQWDRETDG